MWTETGPIGKGCLVEKQLGRQLVEVPGRKDKQ